jgi:hypothetical protein
MSDFTWFSAASLILACHSELRADALRSINKAASIGCLTMAGEIRVGKAFLRSSVGGKEICLALRDGGVLEYALFG